MTTADERDHDDSRDDLYDADGAQDEDGPRLAALVAVRHPRTHEPVILQAGSVAPRWARAMLRSPSLWDGGKVPDGVEEAEPLRSSARLSADASITTASPAALPADDGGAPPRRGAGSSAEHWAEFARAHGVPVDADMGRDQIIAACEAHGVPIGS